jgi:hypothetical protein
VTGGKPIAVLLQSISGVSAVNPLVAFYDIHGGKREVLFFYFVPDTTREIRGNRVNQGLQKVNRGIPRYTKVYHESDRKCFLDCMRWFFYPFGEIA